MFDPMYAGDGGLLELILLGLAGLGFLVGWYWIRRAWKDVEDN